MRYGLPYLLAVACSACLVCAVLAAGSFAKAAMAADRCVEDMPCWTWSTMGNHKRGVVSDAGRRVVVGPCRFTRMARRGTLDSSTPHLRGDRWALRHGCRH